MSQETKEPEQHPTIRRAQKAIQLARQHLMQLDDKVPVSVHQELIDTFHALTSVNIKDLAKLTTASEVVCSGVLLTNQVDPRYNGVWVRDTEK